MGSGLSTADSCSAAVLTSTCSERAQGLIARGSPDSPRGLSLSKAFPVPLAPSLWHTLVSTCGAEILPSPIWPLHHLAPGGDKGAERGYFLGVGRSVGLGLLLQVLEGRFLSSLELRVAAGTNQPLVWGRVGDDLSHRPFRWDVLLL